MTVSLLAKKKINQKMANSQILRFLLQQFNRTRILLQIMCNPILNSCCQAIQSCGSKACYIVTNIKDRREAGSLFIEFKARQPLSKEEQLWNLNLWQPIKAFKLLYSIFHPLTYRRGAITSGSSENDDIHAWRDSSSHSNFWSIQFTEVPQGLPSIVSPSPASSI